MKPLKRNAPGLIPALLCIVLFASLSACGDSPSGEKISGEVIFEKSDLENSLLGFGWFDGKSGKYGFFNEDRFEILDSLKKVNAVPAPDFTPDKMTYPVYAFDPHGSDGFDMPFLWTNGYLIAKDGTAYRFKYDFAALRKKGFSTNDTGTISSVSVFQNGFRLALDEKGWNASRLTKAAELKPAEGVNLQLASQDEKALKLTLQNTGEQTWLYGEDYFLQVLLDGVWYAVPPMTPDGVVFTAIGYSLEPGQTSDIFCSLLPYEGLPKGQYRVCKSLSLEDKYGRYTHGFTMSADFSIE